MNNRIIVTAALALGGSAGFLMGSSTLRTQAQPTAQPAVSHADASEAARIAALEKRVNALEARLKTVTAAPSLQFIPQPGSTYRFNPAPPNSEWRVVPLDKAGENR